MYSLESMSANTLIVGAIVASSSLASHTLRIGRLCAPLLPNPGPTSECIVERLQLGNSNQLYALTRTRGCAAEKFLVREFGTVSALALDRDVENTVFSRLANLRIAPPLVATFDGGRIEGWLDGRPCSAQECRTPTVYEGVARAFAMLHSAPIETIDPGADPTSCWGWEMADQWLAGARDCAACLQRMDGDEMFGDRATPDDLHKLTARVRAIDLERIGDELSRLRMELDSRPGVLWHCYCHNDVSNTNVHRNVAQGTVRLIDFEFGGVNLRGFDLATHLSHWAGGALDGRYEPAAFPTPAERAPFLSAYARASAHNKKTVVTLEQLDAEVRAATPLVHCVWGLWALCTLPTAVASGHVGGRFSHIEYAERRLRAFDTALAQWRAEKQVGAAILWLPA